MIELRMHPAERAPLSTILETERRDAPLAYVTLGRGSRYGVDYDVTTISLYFEQNIATGPGSWCFPTLSCLGYHEHDIEFISIYSTVEHVEWVFFSAHSPGQGQWLKWEDCEMTGSGNLVVYVARGSHALYPKAGTYWRLFGLANDVCSDRCDKIVIPFQRMIPSYDHVFPNGIRLYETLRPTPPPLSITPWQRFFILFYKDAL